MHEIAGRVAGVVLEPGDAGFDAELAAFNLAVRHAPALVVGAASTDDIVVAVRYAAEHGHAIRVQSTGHGAHAPILDGVVITTHRLDGVAVDPESRVATVGAGVRWRDVIEAAAPHGLAPVSGSSPTVGVAGYLLGGGLGPLARSHGFSSDRLLGATVVTAAGDVVEAAPEGDADLLWALRGGKSGLGIVTELRIALAPIPELYAGSLTFDGAHADAVVRGWIDWTATAPDDVTTSLALLRFPDLPMLPAAVRGRFLVQLRFAVPASSASGERVAAPLRALAPVEVDALGPLPLADVGLIHADPTDPGPSWGWGCLLDRLDAGFADALLAQLGATPPPPFLVVEVRHLGAATRVDVPEGSAVGGRAGAAALHIVGAPDPALFAEVLPAAAAGFAAAIAPWIAATTTANWANDLADPVEAARVWPGATGERLDGVRRRVDPERRLRRP